MCADCGEVIAVHEHSSWQEIKDCQARTPSFVCSVSELAGMPVRRSGGRGQEVKYQMHRALTADEIDLLISLRLRRPPRHRRR